MKIKLLILQEFIPNYRLPIFRDLALKYELTIGCPNYYNFDNELFKTKKIRSFQIKNLYAPDYSLIKFCKLFDVVIIMPDLHFLNYCFLPFMLVKQKVISWSIGFRASYKLKYNQFRKKTFLDFALLLILKKCDANIFYYDMPKLFWGKLLNENKIFTATNTVEVSTTSKLMNTNFENKKSIIFLGSLINGKGILEFIYLFNKILTDIKNFDVKLIIIGDGPLKKSILNYINKNNLKENIFVKGAIYDEDVLASYFYNSLCMITPKQAGLSVLKSMGYGVPVVTSYDSITGGERFNIKEDNGFLYHDEKELENIITQCFFNPSIFLQKGINAKSYYQSNTSIKQMTKGFEEAINFVLTLD